MENPKIILGLCCINSFLQNKYNIRSRTIARKNYTVEEAIKRAKLNLEDLKSLLEYNNKHNIRSFRISSTILPRYTDPLVESYDMEIFQDLFEEIGLMAKAYNIRLSFHPDQFAVLSTTDPKILKQSIAEIEYQAEILHRMGVPSELGVCNIHGGGLYESEYKDKFDNKETLRAFCKERVFKIWVENYNKLSDIAKKYLTLEHDERMFNLNDCLKISDMCDVPVIYDTHHEECYVLLHPEENHIPVSKNLHRVLKSWTNRNKIPMAHISNQCIDSRVGKHSDYINRVPDTLYEYAKMCPNKTLYVDVEARAKEEAIFLMREKFEYMH